ncbi:NAD(P)-dependent oxidoreductase, partial [Methylobacterium frigidaeris]|uniref:NAD(P)-dependent oxidoreductase n=1 Tax=Methylobacterium frigidaeris TaxID=2038277 RepID=UPI0023592346
PQPHHYLLDYIIREHHVINQHAPLTSETRNIIGRDELTRMKLDPILINTACGGLCDEAAIGEALESGTIGGAGYDVRT